MQHKSSIPAQVKGSKSDTYYSRTFKNEQAAQNLYIKAKTRLLDVSKWHNLPGHTAAEFTLTDNKGDKVQRPVIVYDHFRINIPAPGNISGDGYDWVQVEEVQDITDPGSHATCSIRVRPVGNPKADRTETSSHFFKDYATSTFMVTLAGRKVTASVHGRNEVPNNEQRHLWDIVRNTVIAFAAMLGFSSGQWKKLVRGLLS